MTGKSLPVRGLLVLVPHRGPVQGPHEPPLQVVLLPDKAGPLFRGELQLRLQNWGPIIIIFIPLF